MVFRSLLLFSPAALLKTNGIFRPRRRHLQGLEKAPSGLGKGTFF